MTSVLLEMFSGKDSTLGKNGTTMNLLPTVLLPSARLRVQDFLIKLDMKPCMHLVETSIFSLDPVIVTPTKIMNRADKNWANF